MLLRSVVAAALVLGASLPAAAQVPPVFVPPSAPGNDLLLFGGPEGDEFLGCLTCSSYDPKSVFNPYGRHGSKYEPGSIWNPHGRNGSKYSPSSPWNEYAAKPPRVHDRSGSYYGVLSANEYRPDRVPLPSLRPQPVQPLAPPRPLQRLQPLQPLQPLRPLQPLQPLVPLTPHGGCNRSGVLTPYCY